MKKLLPFAAAIALLIVPSFVFADTVITKTVATTAANTTSSTQNTNETDYAGGASQFDLDHHNAYNWKITGLSVPAGQTIISAQLCFKNIANWDTNANKLFVHLMNTASNTTGTSLASGVRYVQDNPNDNSTDDYFSHGVSSLGPAQGVDNIKLFEKSFNMVGQGGYVAQNYVYNFTAAQLATLASYIAASGDIAFGFDPDCHYWNNGITFTYTTASVPEPVSMLLLGTGLAGLYVRHRRQQN